MTRAEIDRAVALRRQYLSYRAIAARLYYDHKTIIRALGAHDAWPELRACRPSRPREAARLRDAGYRYAHISAALGYPSQWKAINAVYLWRRQQRQRAHYERTS